MARFVNRTLTLAGVAVLIDFATTYKFRPNALGIKNDDPSNTLTAQVVPTDGDPISILPGDYLQFDGEVSQLIVNGTGQMRVFGCENIEQLPSLTNLSGDKPGVDGTTIAYTGGGLGVKDGGLGTAKLTDGAVTGPKITPSKSLPVAAAGDRVTGILAGSTETFATKHTIGANKLLANSLIRFRVSGVCTTKPGGSAQTAQIRVRLGGVVIGTATAALNSALNDTFVVQGEAIILSTGAGGTFNGVADLYYGHEGAGTAKTSHGVTVAGAINTTIANDLDVQVIFAADATAGDTIDLATMSVEAMGTVS